MIKEIIVAGIKLNNYTTMENLLQMRSCMEKNQFITVQEVYMKTLLLAKENEVVKTAIESLDVSVIAETDILDAVGENTVLRKREIEKREFFQRLMKIIERNNYTIYVLGETGKKVEDAIRYIKEEFPRIQFAGFHSLEECVGAEEGIINDINMKSPDVILSVLPSPIQEQFLVNHKSMLLAKLWYGVSDRSFKENRNTLSAKLMKLFRRRKLSLYEEETQIEEEGKENEGI